jgi:hypothetical protein
MTNAYIGRPAGSDQADDPDAADRAESASYPAASATDIQETDVPDALCEHGEPARYCRKIHGYVPPAGEQIAASVDGPVVTESASVEALLTERFGPLPRREPGTAGRRMRFIATMHALIGWLVEHPEVPVPWAVSLNIHVPDVAALVELGKSLGVQPAQAGRTGSEPWLISMLGNEVVDSEFYTPVSIHVRGEARPL